MELTAELVEVRLDFPPGVEEYSAFLRANCDHAVLVDGDARHLRVELRHRHALQDKHTAIVHSLSLKFNRNTDDVHINGKQHWGAAAQ